MWAEGVQAMLLPRANVQKFSESQSAKRREKNPQIYEHTHPGMCFLLLVLPETTSFTLFSLPLNEFFPPFPSRSLVFMWKLTFVREKAEESGKKTNLRSIWTTNKDVEQKFCQPFSVACVAFRFSLFLVSINIFSIPMAIDSLSPSLWTPSVCYEIFL